MDLSHFVKRDDVTKAEVLWILHVIENHLSYNSNQNFTAVVQSMFPDSSIAKQMKLKPKKIGYVVSFGLAPYFKEKLTDLVKKSDYFVACFDEALNKVIQKGQLDVWVRYWNWETNRIVCSYFNSAFMGHARAENVLKYFLQGLEGLEIEKLVQIGMDGPNMNWKFLENFKKETESEEDSKKVLELGSCGLHVLHGAFQTGHTAAGWNINGFLRAVYLIFKDSPARRDDFSRITESSVYPKKFCGHRCLENVPVVERILSLLPKIAQYVDQVTPKPKIASFVLVQEALKDKLLKPKLEFFKSLASEVEPFLSTYQTSKPMAPFLFDDLVKTLETLMSRVVKQTVMKDLTVGAMMKILKKLDENSPELRPATQIDIGRGARRAMPQASSGSVSELAYFKCCQSFLIKMMQKIMEERKRNIMLLKEKEAKRRRLEQEKALYDTEIAALQKKVGTK